MHHVPAGLVGLFTIGWLLGCAGGGASGGATTAPTTDPPGEEACPTDLQAAIGTSCHIDGKTCTGGQTQFTHLVMCSSGKWVEMEAPPPPPPPPG